MAKDLGVSVSEKVKMRDDFGTPQRKKSQPKYAIPKKRKNEKKR